MSSISYKLYFDYGATDCVTLMCHNDGDLCHLNISRLSHSVPAQYTGRYPQSQVRLAKDRLTVDARVFVWDRLSGKVEEQRLVTIPVQGEVITATNGSNRCNVSYHGITFNQFWILSELLQRYKLMTSL